jgi:hypothetical protein
MTVSSTARGEHPRKGRVRSNSFVALTELEVY